MKILIFSGGSGSHELQKGLWGISKDIEISILTNGYDNGLSTGLIRTVFNGEILGPSDIRKNQTRHNTLVHNDDVSKFIEHRFTSSNPKKYIHDFAKTLEYNEKINKLLKICDDYFSCPNALNIEYSDFSIGNIIYGYLSFKNNNSLQSAADIMRSILEIPQKTILNSDESLFLMAETKSGKTLFDEADIVDYGDYDDHIKSISFIDVNGKSRKNSFLSERAISEINSADIIIFSTGTQWSSLIPTYQCDTPNGESFRQIIKKSKGKKFLLLNSQPDKDMYGLNGDDILDILSKYFDISDTTVICGINSMQPSKYDARITELTDSHINKYEGKLLAKEILWLYYRMPLYESKFIFDWDGTIHGRRGAYQEQSEFNVSQLPSNSIVVTGNSFSKITTKNIPIYADGGINLYEDGLVTCLDKKCLLNDSLVRSVLNMLCKFKLNSNLLSLRGNVCISLKPIDSKYRHLLCDSLNNALPDDYDATITGLSTIDIKHKSNTKLKAIESIRSKTNTELFYIGDELQEGNDKIVEDNKEKFNLKTISVSNPADTSIFIKSIK